MDGMDNRTCKAEEGRILSARSRDHTDIHHGVPIIFLNTVRLEMRREAASQFHVRQPARSAVQSLRGS